MHTKAAQHKSTTATLPSANHEASSAIGFQAAWQGTRTARHQAPLHTLPLQVTPGRTTFTARRHTFSLPFVFTVVAWRFPCCCQAPHQYSRSTGSGLGLGAVVRILIHWVVQPIQLSCHNSITVPHYATSITITKPSTLTSIILLFLESLTLS